MASVSVGAYPLSGALSRPSGPLAEPSPGPSEDPPQGPLENYADSATPSGALPARSRRYIRRSALWKESSLLRVRRCGRVRRAEFVGVRVGSAGAGFSGLCTCGSPWACPVCNAKIMARRALEIGLAIAAHQATGGRVIFQTLTLRHHAGQSLIELWSALLAAWRSATTGKAWAGRRSSLGMLGWIRAVEVTWGRHGWHVHIHALLFVGPEVERVQVAEFGSWLADRWSRAVVRQGLEAPLAAGQFARLVTGPADADLAAYISKATDLGLELTQSQSKRARRGHKTVSPWSLLGDVIDKGDADALDRWHVWEQGSKNRRQITWSKNLRRALLGQEREVSDEEIADQQAGDVDVVLITAEGWDSVVARPWLMPALLVAAEDSVAALRALLIRQSVEFVVPGGPS